MATLLVAQPNLQENMLELYVSADHEHFKKMLNKYVSYHACRKAQCHVINVLKLLVRFRQHNYLE